MPPTAHILLIIDNAALAEDIQGHLQTHGFTVECLMNEEQAINGIVSGQFDGIISTIQSPKIDGLRLLDIARERNATTPVLMLLEENQMELGIQALDRGAHNIQTSSINLDLLERHIRQGLEQQATQYEVFQLKRQLDRHHGLSNVIGQSHAMASIHDQIRQSATGNTPIILVGETGTGKDHLALTIHNQSTRSRRAFIKVAYANEQSDLLERDLFGYAPGIYPDAPAGQAGQIESADEGTLYLDNLNHISRMQHEQLLLCLEKRIIQRFGDTRDISVDTRLIISITPPLKDGDATQEFLSTLHQKYGAVTLEIPALRNRSEDISALLKHFLTVHGNALGKSVEDYDQHALDALLRYPWPENVRELSNAVEHMLIATPNQGSIAYNALPLAIREHPLSTPDTIAIPRRSDMHTVERILIEDTMKAYNNDKQQCAQTLGIGLRTLYRKLKEYDSDG